MFKNFRLIKYRIVSLCSSSNDQGETMCELDRVPEAADVIHIQLGTTWGQCCILYLVELTRKSEKI